MFYYSKSKYVTLCGCKRRLWLEKYKPEEKEEQEENQRLIVGNEIGDMAMGLFGDYYLAETDPIDIPKMVENTKEAIARGEGVICEAAFIYENNYCAVDILKVLPDKSVEIYEVKSVTKVKPYHITDTSYQYYILSNLGFKVNSVNIVLINKDYIRVDGDVNLNDYFIIEDVTEKAIKKSEEVKANLEISDNYLANENELPDVALSSTCLEYDGCPFKNYCFRLKGIPSEGSVLDLYSNRNKWKMINDGIISFYDLNNDFKYFDKLSDIQKRQIDFYLYDRGLDINKKQIKVFLDELEFPLYFFDFETYQKALPDVIGAKPNQQIPFQYSLHIMESDGTITHKEYLGDGINDPRFPLIKQMLNDLGDSGSIIAYNESFEISRIKELAYNFKPYSSKLYKLVSRFKDLLIPFQEGYVYNRAMGGSFSIKSVLPALFPNDQRLNYHNLDDVHKGDEASQAYIDLKNMDIDSKNKIRHSLLKYCELDTYAMVVLYEKLVELIKEE